MAIQLFSLTIADHVATAAEAAQAGGVDGMDVGSDAANDTWLKATLGRFAQVGRRYVCDTCTFTRALHE